MGMLLVALGISSAANAITITGSVGGAPTGVNYLNFDDLAPTVFVGTYVATTPSGSVQVGITPNAKIVTGAVSGEYAAPWLSGGNGVGFGSPNQANGADTTV